MYVVKQAARLIETWEYLYKISKGNYGVFNSSKNELKISDLASKKRSNQRAWVSTDTRDAWHLQKVWTADFGNFTTYYICFTLEFWGFTSDRHPLFQISNSSPAFLYSLGLFSIKKWPLYLVIQPLLEAMAEIFSSFLEELKTSGFPFEMSWPLAKHLYSFCFKMKTDTNVASITVFPRTVSALE